MSASIPGSSSSWCPAGTGLVIQFIAPLLLNIGSSTVCTFPRRAWWRERWVGGVLSVVALHCSRVDSHGPLVDGASANMVKSHITVHCWDIHCSVRKYF